MSVHDDVITTDKVPSMATEEEQEEEEEEMEECSEDVQSMEAEEAEEDEDDVLQETAEDDDERMKCINKLKQQQQQHVAMNMMNQRMATTTSGGTIKPIPPATVDTIMHSYRIYTVRGDKSGQSSLSPLSTTTNTSSSDPHHASTSTTTIPPPTTSSTITGDRLDEESSTTVPTSPTSGQTSASAETHSLSVPVKPILMCFICKISFGNTKSFVTHTTQEHHLDLLEEESRLLGQKNVSAIIQSGGNSSGKDGGNKGEPILSFLEPKQPNANTTSPIHPSLSATNAANVSMVASSPPFISSSPLSSLSPPSQQASSNNCGTTTTLITSSSSGGNNNNNCNNSTISKNNNNSNNSLSPSSAAAAIGAPSSSAGDLHQQFQQQLMAMQVAALAAMRSSSSTATGGVSGDNGGGQVSSSITSSSSASASSSTTTIPSSSSSSMSNNMGTVSVSTTAAGSIPTTTSVMDQLLLNTTKDNNKDQSRPSSNGSINLVMPKNNNNSDDNNGGGDGKDGDGCSELADLANLEKIAKAAAAAIQSQQVEFEQQLQGMQLAYQQQQSASIAGGNLPSMASPPSSQSPTNNNTVTNTPMSLMAMVTASPKNTPTGQQHQSQQQYTPGITDSHMTMMHSRNSCKTLKCPKCNWHYKYQETLEIHMKEKHPENEMNCIYCLTNQSHPRLARGETYTCGYKPYRCEVCNYSTTTKGNLSIHMQSDKHINNVQELQNGGTIPSSATTANIPMNSTSSSVTPNQTSSAPSNEHLLQTQALAQAVAMANAAGQAAAAAAAAKSGNSSPGPNTSDKVSPMNQVPNVLLGGVCPSPLSVNQSGNNAPSTPTSGSSSNKPKATWRCDVCNYETGVARNLRIHMTSEKHTHNMVVLQQSVKHYQVMQQQAGLMAAMSGAAGGNDQNQMLAAAAAASQMHPGILAALAAAAAASAGTSGSSPVPSLPSPSSHNHGQSGDVSNNTPEAALADIAYNHAVLMMQTQQQRAMAAMMSGAAGGGSSKQFGGQGQSPMIDMEHPDPSFRFDSIPYDENSRTYQCCVCTVHTCDSIEQLSQHIQSDRTRIREDEVTMSMVSGTSGGNVSVCKMCSYKTNLKANFQLHCKTDKHLQRLQQVNHIKEGGHRSEWKLKYVNVSNPIQVRCNLCDYYTNSIHKLQLHASNPRHETSSRVFVHLQLSETILRSSQRDNGRDKIYYYNCSLCNYAAKTKIGLVHHVNSMKHSSNELTRQQQRSMSNQGNKSLEEEIREVIQVKELHSGDNIVFNDNELTENQNHNSSSFAATSSSSAGDSKSRLMHHRSSSPTNSIEDLSMSGNNNQQQQQSGHQSPSPSLSSSHSRPSSAMNMSAQGLPPGMDPMMMAALNFENSFLKHALQEQERQQQLNSPRFDTNNGSSCPFCNYTCSSDVKMQLHVLTQHANKQQSQQEQRSQKMSIQRLLCPLCQEGFEERIRLETHLMDVHNVTKEGVERLLTIVDTTSQDVSQQGPESKKRKITSNDDVHDDGRSDTSSTDGREESIEQTAARFLKLGGGVPLAAVSDRHVYKYRCQQCSLAFKTKEKLQLHSQYHLIRAATQCILCNRSFRSVEALQRHVESSHRDMTDNEVESYRASLANNPFIGRNGLTSGILDPSTTELLLKESNRGNEDIDGEDAAMDLAMSSLEQSIEQDKESDLMNSVDNNDQQHHTLEDYLNSQAMAEDSYNDPSRKYKCHRCKVAFTRQSYLTAHNKTLLHRKGEKVDYPMEKYLDPNRPFKCEICKESFTQKNILLVHYNSVSHLHRQKQMKMKEDGTTSSRTNSINNNNDVPMSLSPNVDSSLFPPPSTESLSPSSGDEKKPFKCNICRVSYNLSSSLDIHIRSVLHQSRASKINELILTGQIDLSAPFIERGEEVPGKTDSNLVGTKSSPPSKESSPFGMNELQLQQQLQQQLALAAMAAAAQQGNTSSVPNSNQGSSGVFPCGRCGALFPSQDICMQHSQLCSLFGPPMVNDVSGGNGAQRMSMSQSSSAAALSSSSAGASAASKVFYSAPTHRTKPPIYKHLLETFGFEIVMQFNEHHQRRKKLKTTTDNGTSDNTNKELNDTNVMETSGDVGESSSTTAKDNDSPSEKICSTSSAAAVEAKEQVESKEEGMDITTTSSKKDCPEINRSTCNVCLKEFSSVWVLKAHKEEVHKDVVPFDLLESFANEYRKTFEEKKSSRSSSQCLATDEPSSDVQQPTEPVQPMSRSRPTPSQTPTGAGHSTPIPQSNQGNRGSSPSPMNSIPAGLLDGEGAMNPAAAQLAAQMQFSQLLMSMGLAGMGVPGMVNNPFAAAAAMGIPPQMIPLMMASGQFDPMMAAAAFNHQAAAAAAVQGLAPGPSPIPSSTGPSPGPMVGPSDPLTSFAAQQQKILQQQQLAAAAAAQQGKRARTRITDEQLKILRQYFDINNSPSEEALAEMSEKSGLPLKVIKHWFRNTLFKERQRNKDSPYNFNNPPSTFLNLEEYEKTGETKITSINSTTATVTSAPGNGDGAENIQSTSSSAAEVKSTPSTVAGKVAPVPLLGNDIKPINTSVNDNYNVMHHETPKMSAGRQPMVKTEEMSSSDDDNAARINASRSSIEGSGSNNDNNQLMERSTPTTNTQQGGAQSGQSSAPSSLRESFDYAKSFSMSPHSESSMSSISTNDAASQNGAGQDGHGHGNNNFNRMNALSQQQQAAMFAAGLPSAFAAAAGLGPTGLGNPLAMAIDAAQRSQSVSSSQGGGGNSQSTPQRSSSSGQQNDAHGGSPGSNSGPGKRANRTRFTDYQIKVLQEFFESNAYPKDDDLEYLSKLLNLSPRVIVVWFQNARQKARKVYENQPAAPDQDDTSQGRFQRTPGLNYQCKKCQQVFQRYYELIKHQKSACFKDENPLSAHFRAAVAASSSGGNNNQRNETRSTSPSGNVSNMSNHSTSNTPTPDHVKAASPSSNAFRCEKCSLVFPRFDLWREHQLVHLMNPNLFPNAYPPSSPFGILQFEGAAPGSSGAAGQPAGNSSSSPRSTMDGVLASIMAQQQQQQAGNPAATPPQQKKKGGSSMNNINNNHSLPSSLPPLPPPLMIDDDDNESLESFSGQGSQTGSVSDRCMNATEQAQRDKRLRTTILPEQLDYLYQKYQIESNPSRKMLENIAKEVGLKKRVVQVWFQNTRARERKGQFRAHQQVIHKRCPFCRALFKARSALESHLATRHADQYTKGDINIDALPDGEPDDLPQTPFGLMASLGLNTDNDGNNKNNVDASSPDMQAKAAWKKYMEEFAAAVPNVNDLPPELALTMRAALGGRLPGDLTTSSPLDLSKPVDLTRSFGAFASMAAAAASGAFDGSSAGNNNGYDSHSDNEDDMDGQSNHGSDLEEDDDHDDNILDSPTSANSSVHGHSSPAAIGSVARNNSTSSNSNNNNNNNKRFRTQMTTVQLKVMKSIFADYKTPSMAECDSLGRDIGLPKRVIQVWFQNARAKEKKARLNFLKSFGHEMPEPINPKTIDGCKVCSVRYNSDVSSTAMQDHLFSKTHLDNLRLHIECNKKSSSSSAANESADESVDYPAASMIVMPSNHHHGGGHGNNSGPPSGDEAPMEMSSGQAVPSQSVNNLMQLMGLAFSQASTVPGMSDTTDVNGTTTAGARTPNFMGANSFMSNHVNQQQFKQPNL